MERPDRLHGDDAQLLVVRRDVRIANEIPAAAQRLGIAVRRRPPVVAGAPRRFRRQTRQERIDERVPVDEMDRRAGRVSDEAGGIGQKERLVPPREVVAHVRPVVIRHRDAPPP